MGSPRMFYSQGISDEDYIRGIRSKSSQSRLENLRPGLVRTDGLRCNHRIEPQAVAFEHAFEQRIVRVRHDGARDALKHFQDSPDFWICLCLPPTRFQGFDIGIRIGLDAMIAESFAEALSRELR